MTLISTVLNKDRKNTYHVRSLFRNSSVSLYSIIKQYGAVRVDLMHWSYIEKCCLRLVRKILSLLSPLRSGTAGLVSVASLGNSRYYLLPKCSKMLVLELYKIIWSS
jgi:hypothetical protein